MPIDLTLPKFAVPTTLKSCGSPRVVIVTLLPTGRSSSAAMPVSMTTSPGPAAQRPAERRNGVSASAPGVLASSPTPKYGPSPIGFPSRPMTLASSVMSAAATATPGTARTRSRSPASTVGRFAVQSPASTSNAVRAPTTASVPSYAARDSESAAPRIVSVIVKAALTMATPSTTASAVSAVRSGRAASEREGEADHRRASPRIASMIWSSPGDGQVADDPAVGEEQDAVGGRRRARVVRDHHGRLAVAVDRLAQQREHGGAGARVEVAGRLVGEQHRRPGDQRTRDRDALLLAAGQLGRLVAAPVGQADPLDAARRPRHGPA